MPQPPDFDLNQLRHVYAGSLLEQFARDHDAPAILRELAQNEFDAGGSVLRLAFGSTQLDVSGNGRGIDRSGWQRLALSLGTGQTQEGIRVDEKKNSIGSKNFGLRSLFRWGDQIRVRSNGLATLLELQRGVLPSPIADPESYGQNGVLIQVPFRAAPSSTMPSFTPEDEQVALHELELSAAGSLLKLLTGSGEGIKEVHITSERCGATVHWKQSIRKDKTSTPRIEVLKRFANLTVEDELGRRTARIEELEFRRAVVIPDRFKRKLFASYFSAGRSRIFVSISVKCSGGKVMASEPGRFYYPILVDKGWTGCSLSISAPFEMDGDRSAIRSCSGEPWNDWLTSEAAAFAIDLVRGELQKRFGRAAWSLLVKRHEPADPTFHDRLMTALKEEEIWPVRKGKRITFMQADKCVVAVLPEFDHFLGEERYVLKDLSADAELRELTRWAGVTHFDLDRVLAFRVAGEKDQPKWFKGAVETRWYSPNFPNQWSSVDLQVKFADVLEKHWKNLTEDQRNSVRAAPSAMAADGSLAPYLSLSSVDPEVARTLGIPPAEQVHPSLRPFRRSLELCRKFDFRAWVAEVAGRVAKGANSPDERDALFNQLLRGELANRDDIRKLRGIAVFKDHRGEWAKASSMVLKTAKGAKELEPVLSFPAQSITAQRNLTKYLAIRTKLTSKDLLKLFEAVESQPELASHALQMLTKFEKTWLPRIYVQISRLKFIDIDGVLRAPSELYMASPKIVECLGDGVEYAGMLSSRMQVNLGCKQQPTCGDIVARLLALREVGTEPKSIVYKALAQGLESERLDRAVILSQPIFWNGSSFVTGTAILLSPKHRNHFLGLYDSGPDDKDMQSAFVSIGVSTIPSLSHWVRLLLHFAEKMKGADSVPSKLRPVLQDIYENLKGSPPELPPNIQCLLAEDGRLYTMADARASRILIADQTDLSQAVRAQGVVALCDVGDGRGFSFFTTVGVRRLSEVARLIETQPGRQVDQDGVRGLREWIKSPSLRSAIKSIVRGLQLPFTGRLDALITKTCIGASGFVAVDRVTATYRIGQKRLTVSKPYVLKSGVVYVSAGQGRLQMLSSISNAIAVQVCRGNQEEFTLHLQTVLSSRSGEEVREYLAGKNIPWVPISGGKQDSLFDSPEVNLGNLLEDSLKPGPGDEKPRITRPTPTTSNPPARTPLPPLQDVRLGHEPITGTVISGKGKKGVGSGGYGGGSTRLPDTEYDRVLGRRGEELVYREELEKVEANGFEKSRVVWTSKDDPLAPWDILSVDAAGAEIWIEVKATTGRDGRFVWSAAEFRAAVAKGDRYVLVRIYEVDRTNPTRKDFPNPIRLLQNGTLNLEVGSLSAEVEGL